MDLSYEFGLHSEFDMMDDRGSDMMMMGGLGAGSSNGRDFNPSDPFSRGREGGRGARSIPVSPRGISPMGGREGEGEGGESPVILRWLKAKVRGG